MDLDPDDVFRDDDDDPDNEVYQVFYSSSSSSSGSTLINSHLIVFSVFDQERESTKELVVYLVDASPKMFSSTCLAVSFLLRHTYPTCFLSCSPSFSFIYIKCLQFVPFCE
jgi:hypothetical protein